MKKKTKKSKDNYLKSKKPNPRWSARKLKRWAASRQGHRWAGFTD
jgi:hypothetical protein